MPDRDKIDRRMMAVELIMELVVTSDAKVIFLVGGICKKKGAPVSMGFSPFHL